MSSEQTVWYASQWRDGKLLWYRAFESESEAVKAVRAREQAMSRENLDDEAGRL